MQRAGIMISTRIIGTPAFFAVVLSKSCTDRLRGKLQRTAWHSTEAFVTRGHSHTRLRTTHLAPHSRSSLRLRGSEAMQLAACVSIYAADTRCARHTRAKQSFSLPHMTESLRNYSRPRTRAANGGGGGGGQRQGVGYGICNFMFQLEKARFK